MPFEHTFYAGAQDNDPLFRMVFRDVNGNELTPASARVDVFQDDKVQVITDQAATIFSNEVKFLYTTVVLGKFMLYFTATFAATSDVRTEAISFRVITMDGRIS